MPVRPAGAIQQTNPQSIANRFTWVGSIQDPVLPLIAVLLRTHTLAKLPFPYCRNVCADARGLTSSPCPQSSTFFLMGPQDRCVKVPLYKYYTVYRHTAPKLGCNYRKTGIGGDFQAGQAEKSEGIKERKQKKSLRIKETWTEEWKRGYWPHCTAKIPASGPGNSASACAAERSTTSADSHPSITYPRLIVHYPVNRARRP